MDVSHACRTNMVTLAAKVSMISRGFDYLGILLRRKPQLLRITYSAKVRLSFDLEILGTHKVARGRKLPRLVVLLLHLFLAVFVSSWPS